MTATQLLILIGILAVARGVFLLFPRLEVRAYALKLALVGCTAVMAYFLTRPDVLERIPMQGKYVLIALSLFAILFLIPGGILTDAQKKTLLEYMDSVIIAGVTALVLITYVVRSFYIPSGSMEDTLQIDDMILVNEVVYRFYKPARGDIVVFHPPEKAHSEGKDYIKRVVAVEGETIQVKDDVVFINGRQLHEPYKLLKRDTPAIDEPPITVPAGKVFVMGDNRHNSADSREWDFLPEENIIGKAFLIFYPLTRVRVLQ